MPNAPQIRALSLVMVGDFNPTIFQPRWFWSENILTVEEAESAIVQIVHPDVTSFGLPWLNLTVQRERFDAVSAAQPYFERLAGLRVPNISAPTAHTNPDDWYQHWSAPLAVDRLEVGN